MKALDFLPLQSPVQTTLLAPGKSTSTALNVHLYIILFDLFAHQIIILLNIVHQLPEVRKAVFVSDCYMPRCTTTSYSSPLSIRTLYIYCYAISYALSN